MEEKDNEIKIGYSDVIRDPKFIQAVRKNKKSKRGCAMFIILAPAIIIPIYMFFMKEDVLIGLGFGAIISAIFAVLGFLLTFKERFEGSWEGVVEKKYRKEKINYREDNDSINRRETHEYVIIREDNGKKHKIEEIASNMNSRTYSYLKEGDRVCYHGRMGLFFPYEKYDKTKDDYIICAFCRNRTSIKEDTCPKCHNPILK